MVLTDISPDGLRVAPALGQQATVGRYLIFRIHHHDPDVDSLWPIEFGRVDGKPAWDDKEKLVGRPFQSTQI